MPLNQVVTSKITKLYTVNYYIEYEIGKYKLKQRAYRSKSEAIKDIQYLSNNILVSKIEVRDDFGHSKVFAPAKLTQEEEEIKAQLLADNTVPLELKLSSLRPEIRQKIAYLLDLPTKKCLKDVDSICEELGIEPDPKWFATEEHKKAAKYRQKQFINNRKKVKS